MQARARWSEKEPSCESSRCALNEGRPSHKTRSLAYRGGAQDDGGSLDGGGGGDSDQGLARPAREDYHPRAGAPVAEHLAQGALLVRANLGRGLEGHGQLGDRRVAVPFKVDMQPRKEGGSKWVLLRLM